METNPIEGKADLPKPSPELETLVTRLDSKEFTRHKFHVVLWIMSIGIFLAFSWECYQKYALGKGYPYTTFLFSPAGRFGDFEDTLLTAHLPNPYANPLILYLPFTWAFFRTLFPAPGPADTTIFFFLCLSAITILLTKVLEPIISGPWKRVGYSYFLTGISYPMIFTFDRGNIDILLAALVGGSIYLFARNKFMLGMLCLVPAISFKLYPVIFLVLLLRQRKVALTAFGLIMVFGLNFISMISLALPWKETGEYYERNFTLFTNMYVYQNYSLEGTASIWNAYKVGLIIANKIGRIAPVDFSVMGLINLTLILYVLWVEKEFLRCVVILSLSLTVGTASGGDYRLLYACPALVSLILLKTRRSNDMLILVLVTLVVVPKKLFFLTFAGKTETNFSDVSVDVLLNPILVTAAIALLVYDGCKQSDLRWGQRRFFNLCRAILPPLPAFGRGIKVISQGDRVKKGQV
jgi:hypothetical protein